MNEPEKHVASHGSLGAVFSSASRCAWQPSSLLLLADGFGGTQHWSERKGKNPSKPVDCRTANGFLSVFSNRSFRKLSALARGACVTNEPILFLQEFPPFLILSLMRGRDRDPMTRLPDLMQFALQRRVFFLSCIPALFGSRSSGECRERKFGTVFVIPPRSGRVRRPTRVISKARNVLPPLLDSTTSGERATYLRK